MSNRIYLERSAGSLRSHAGADVKGSGYFLRAWLPGSAHCGISLSESKRGKTKKGSSGRCGGSYVGFPYLLRWMGEVGIWICLELNECPLNHFGSSASRDSQSKQSKKVYRSTRRECRSGCC